MIKTQLLHKEIPSSDGTIFTFSGTPGSSLSVVIENEDAANSLTYKWQESADGDTWVDKALPYGAGTQVSFVIAPETAHTVKLPNSSPFYRLVARGSVVASIGLMWFMRVNPATPNTPTIQA